MYLETPFTLGLLNLMVSIMQISIKSEWMLVYEGNSECEGSWIDHKRPYVVVKQLPPMQIHARYLLI